MHISLKKQKAQQFFDSLTNEMLALALAMPIIHRFDQFNKEQLKIYIQEFHAFIDYFPKYLGALIWQCPSEKLRLTIIDNLIDELGGIECVEKMNLSKTHPALFRDIGHRLGLTEDKIKNARLKPYTVHMLKKLETLSNQPHFLVSMGGVSPGLENIFHAWIDRIYDGFKKQGFSEKELYYFNIHVTLDIEHANKFKASILPLLINNETCQQLREGALEMTKILSDFFLALEKDIDSVSVE